MLPWHSEIWARLNERLAHGRLPHALLLAGPPGTGKRLFARAYAESLLCEQRGADGHACGNCPSCRLLAAGTHPDLHLLRPALVALAEGVAADAGRTVSMLDWCSGIALGEMFPDENAREREANRRGITLVGSHSKPTGRYYVVLFGAFPVVISHSDVELGPRETLCCSFHVPAQSF